MKNLKNNIENYNSHIKNKYIHNPKNRNNYKYKTHYSSFFPENNLNFYKTFNAMDFFNNNKEIKINEFIPISTKYKCNDNFNIINYNNFLNI